MCYRYFQILAIGLIIFGLAGCRGDSPVAPGEEGTSPGASAINAASSHYCWGVWDVSIDPGTAKIEAVPLRTADFNANVVKFLQPPIAPIHMLTIALGPGCEPSTGYWVIDVTLQHPFPGNNNFRGFDARGIIMTEGDAVGIHDPSVSYRGLDGTRLLNADGYTRWWNMQEFTSYGKIFGYTEGARAVPGFNATATVNPYKLFTDALDSLAPLNTMDPDMRATFSASPGINTRRYEMQFDIDGGTPPLRFKYAVDASWSLPDPAYEPEYPIEAYDLSANCQEPYLVDVPNFVESPYYENATSFGGDAEFLLTIGDWQADSGENVIDQISHIWVESPTLIDAPVDVLPTMEFTESTHTTMATYRVTVPDCHPSGLEGQYFLITVESAVPSSYTPQIEGDPSGFEWPDAELAGYAVIDVPISEEAPFYNFGWAKHAGGPDVDSGNAITSLSNDLIVVTGSCQDAAMFGEGEANETVLEGPGPHRLYVAAFNPDGTLEWVKGAGGDGLYSGLGITSLSDDSIVITGGFTDEIIFGEGEPHETKITADHYRDIFVARYNNDGTLEWAKSAGGMDDAVGEAITTLSDDSTVIAGSFTGLVTFGEGEPDETTLEADDYFCDIFIARYNANGMIVWAGKAGGEFDDVAYGIASFSDDSLAVIGYISGTALFGEGEPNQTVLVATGWNEFFVARYYTDGTLAWARNAGGPQASYGFDVTALSNDSMVVTGSFLDSVTFGLGEPNETKLVSDWDTEMFMARYESDGSLAWAKQTSGTGSASGVGICTLTDDSVAVTGSFNGMAVFGEGEPNQTELLNIYNDTYDIFIARYNNDGTPIWARGAGGSDNEAGVGIISLSENSSVITGAFVGQATFGAGEPGETILESYGSNDIFIARYYP